MFTIDSVHFKQLNESNCKPEDKEIVSLFNSISNDKISKIYPYQYQVDVLKKSKEIIDSGKHAVIILRNTTGSGKSLCGYALSLLDTRRSVFMYPTKELVREQFEKFNEYKVNGKTYEDVIPYVKSSAKEINAEELDEIQKEYRITLRNDIKNKYTKANTVSDLYIDTSTIFTTIDSFYYSMSFAYGRNTWITDPKKYRPFYREMTEQSMDAHINATIPDVYFFDEYDSYDIKQQCSIEWMICLLCHPELNQQKEGKCVILASATPNDEFIKRLRYAGITVYDDFVEKSVIKDKDTIQILPKVNVKIITSSNDIKEYRSLTHLQNLIEHKDICDWIVNRYNNKDIKQLVFIGDSVYDCIYISDFFKESYKLDNIGQLHGLSAVDNTERKIIRTKRMVIGNRSIDLGIDFDTDTLVMTAPSPSHILQRLGRLRGSRENIRECIMILPKSVKEFLEKKFNGKIVSRDDFINFIYHGNVDKPIYRWYLTYDNYRVSYAPIEFLNVLWDRYGVLSDHYSPSTSSIEEKQRIKNVCDTLFMKLYHRTIDSVIDQYNAIYLNIADQYKRKEFNNIFMRFRPNSLIDCVVYDTASEFKVHTYNLDFLLRYGKIDPVQTKVIHNFQSFVETFIDPSLKLFYEKNKKYIDKEDVPFVVIHGYKKSEFDIEYSIDITNFAKENPKREKKYQIQIDKKYDITKPTIKNPKSKTIKMYGFEYPIVTYGIKYNVDTKGKIDITDFIHDINEKIQNKNITLFALYDIEMPDKKTTSSVVFEIEAKLMLPLYDQTMSATIKIGKYRCWGMIGLDLQALLLNSAIYERQNYLDHYKIDDIDDE